MASRSPEAASSAADAAVRRLDGGYLRLLDGSDRVLAELRFGIPAFRVAQAGVAEVAAMTPAHFAKATGIAERFEAVAFDGSIQFSGRIGIDLVLDRTHIEAGATVTIGSLTYAEALS